MQTLRRGQPEFGEYTCVVGLGIVRQLTARLYQLAGNYVIGWDTNPSRVAKAKQWGIDAIVENESGPAATKNSHAVMGSTLPCLRWRDHAMKRLNGW